MTKTKAKQTFVAVSRLDFDVELLNVRLDILRSVGHWRQMENSDAR
jgi:hypothetical protein